MKKYNDEVMKILENAKKIETEINHTYVGTEHLMLSLLKEDKIKELLKKYDVDYNSYLKNLKKVISSSNYNSSCTIFTSLLKEVLSYSLELECLENINSIILLKSLLLSDEGIGLKILMMFNVNTYDLLDDINNCLHSKLKNI